MNTLTPQTSRFDRSLWKFLLGLPLITLVPVGAMAERAAVNQLVADRAASPQRVAATPCPMAETTQVTVSFTSQETDLSAVKAKMESRTKELEALAKEAGITSFVLQSMNYSVYANNPGGCNPIATGPYQTNGSMSYSVEPAGKATDFMSLMSKKGFIGGLNVNMYRQCQ
jgi:hypothetical protein